jgi:hypothetical protein
MTVPIFPTGSTVQNRHRPAICCARGFAIFHAMRTRRTRTQSRSVEGRLFAVYEAGIWRMVCRIESALFCMDEECKKDQNAKIRLILS